MGALFLPEADNRARDAISMTIYSGGLPIPGSPVERLRDGRMAPLWRSSSPASTVTITVRVPGGSAIDFASVHDIRSQSGDLVSMRLSLSGNSKQIEIPVSERRRDVRGIWVRLDEPYMNQSPHNAIVTLEFSPGTQFAIGEVAVGLVRELPYAPRTRTLVDEPLVVANGDSRIAVTPSRAVVGVEFPPAAEDDLAPIIAASSGALRPVVMVPRSDRRDVFFGHLAAGSEVEADVYEFQHRSLSLEEARRALR